MAAKDFNYKQAKQELIELLDWFDSGDADLEQALDNYKRAEELIKQLEAYLKDTEQKIKVTVNKQ